VIVCASDRWTGGLSYEIRCTAGASTPAVVSYGTVNGRTELRLLDR
jgi:hypothetical protein